MSSSELIAASYPETLFHLPPQTACTLTSAEVHHGPALHLQQVGTDVVPTDKGQDPAHHRGESACHKVVGTPQAR